MFTDRLAGKSNLGSKQITEYLIQLAQLFWYRWSHRPQATGPRAAE